MIGKTNLSGGENVTPEVTAQTPIIENIMTSLEGKVWEDKKGLYVWKEKIFYEEYPYTLSNPTFNIVVDTSTFENFNISLSSLAKIPPDINDFLNGFEIYDQQNTRRFILTYENGVMYADTQKTITATITLSGTTLTITISNVDIWIGSTGLMKYVGDKTYYVHNVIGETVGFVVSDNSSAYPDGGVQDGYWYEKVVDGIPLPNGYTKFAVDKFTPTSNYTNMNIPHQLGMVPKFALITDNGQVSDFSYVKRLATAIPVGGNANYTNYLSIAQGGEIYIDNSYADTKTTDKYVRFSCTSTKLHAGVEYTLITMA